MKTKIYKHNKISKKIRNIIFCATILSLTLIVNFFHVPIIAYGIEPEKIEFGLLIAFVLVGLIEIKILFAVVFLLPFLDQLLHGHHNLIVAPIESIFNLLILAIVAFVWKALNLNSNNYQTLKNFCFCLICLVLIIILKFFYFGSLWYIFINKPEKEIHPEKISVIFSFFSLISGIKFGIILMLTVISKKWIKKAHIY